MLLVASLCLWYSRRGRAAALLLVGYAAFMLAAADVVTQRLDQAYAGDSMLVRVRIVAPPRVSADSLLMQVEPLADDRVPRRVRVSWFGPPHLPAVGEVWELELRLKRPRGTFNPGVFDYESWLFREKIHATGYVVASQRNRLLWSGADSVLERFRSNYARRAQAATDNREAAAVLVAIGTGQRHLVSREQWDRFAISGTSHLMAISGLHVGLAATASFFVAVMLLGGLAGRHNHYVAAVLFGTACASVYALVSGFGVPAQRAVLMLSAAALSFARRRQVDAGAALALAAALVFLADPIATLTPGFHLSFAAVIMLLWLARRKEHAHVVPRLLDMPRQLLVVQVFLLFGLLPMTAAIFQRFAVAATPVNLLAIPVFSIVTVPLTLAGLAVGEVSESVATVLLAGAGRSIEMLEALIRRVVALPFVDVRLAEFGGMAWALLLLPLAWVVLPRGWPGRRIAVLGVAAIIAWKPAPPPPGCFDSWVLDVGQGLAVVVQTHEGVMLFDTAMAWRGGGSVAAQSIVPFLQSRRIEFIDWLVVSHSDQDHSGGLHAIRDAIPVGMLITGESLEGGSDRYCRAGQRWRSADVDFVVLHPDEMRPGEGNAASCVVRVSAGSHSLLLTGDIEADSERHLRQNGASLASTIVVVPHHGSLTSSTVPFTASVRPDYAVVSAGHANRWGLPKPGVVVRWQAAGAQVLNTASSGAVHFRVCKNAGGVEVSEERQLRHRFWHAER